MKPTPEEKLIRFQQASIGSLERYVAFLQDMLWASTTDICTDPECDHEEQSVTIQIRTEEITGITGAEDLLLEMLKD